MADEQNNEKITTKDAFKGFFANHWRGFMTFLVPIIFLPIMLINFSMPYRCLWVICVMAFYWLLELIPLAVTALLPITLFPVLGILGSDEVCVQYFKEPLVMFLAGLMVALAIEYSNLHKRIALGTIMIVGCRPRRLHAGFTLVTTFISLWISNSAATAMMCPVIKAVLEELAAQGLFEIYKKDNDKTDEEPRPTSLALSYYLGIAYGASIGGCGTLIGTGTNLTFKGLYETRFPNAKDNLDFPIFMGYAVPMVVVCSILMCMLLQIQYLGLFRNNSKVGKEVLGATEVAAQVKSLIRDKYHELGPISCHEIQVLIIFILMVILLFTRQPGFVKGWNELLPSKDIKSATACVLCVLLLFMLPIHYGFCRLCFARSPYPENATPSLLSWKYINAETPWGLVFLLGGGFALAAGSKKSGMAKLLGNALQRLEVLPPELILTIIVLFSIILTNFSSNVAICNIIVPVLNEMSISLKRHPLYFVFPSGLACSMAFHLPVSTPPNAIISGYANIETKAMAIGGFPTSFLACALLILNALTWAHLIYPEIGSFPSWAESKES